MPKQATVLDIGTGANLIYPLIGAYEYQWRFTGSEIGAEAFASAQAIINANPRVKPGRSSASSEGCRCYFQRHYSQERTI